jgi:hypothetical protein
LHIHNSLAPPKKEHLLLIHCSPFRCVNYKKAVQQASLSIPMRNKEGAKHHIIFPEIGDQINLTLFLKLNATFNVGVPIYCYVPEGPAEVEEGTLQMWLTGSLTVYLLFWFAQIRLLIHVQK